MTLARRIRRFIEIARSAMSMSRVLGMIYVPFCKCFSMRPDVVLLESQKGTDFVGNPYYIAQQLLTSDSYRHLKIIVVCPRNTLKRFRNAWGDKPVSYCRVNSIRYLYHLATAAFLVNDTTFPIFFSRREKQKYLNTWHGTPLKTLGRRCSQDRFTSVSNPQRNFLHCTDLLVPNQHTEQVFLQDFMIGNIWRGRLLRCGYPRNDILFNSKQPVALVRGKKINVVFMPTWRGTLSTVDDSSTNQLLELTALFNHLENALPESVTVWVRLHPLMRGALDLSHQKRLHAFPDDVEPYEFLAGCDALVTDYSSVLFDFAVTGKPVFLYTPDAISYREERDFFLSFEAQPFKCLTTPESLVMNLSELVQNPLPRIDGLDEFVSEFCPHDDGHCSELLCAQYFLGQGNAKVVEYVPAAGRKNILIFVGSFQNNGITTSLKTLIPLIDKERLNIILWIEKKKAENHGEDFFSQLDARVHYMPTQSMLAVGPLEAARFFIREIIGNSFIPEIWQREWKRQFANASFDSVIHFTGYERRVAFLLSAVSGNKVVWFHNDMASEVASKRVADPRALRLAYEFADVIATVREGAEQPYCEQYYDFTDKAMYLPNTLGLKCRDLSLQPLHEAFRDGLETTGYGEVSAAVNVPKKFKFINLARFSPEKGQLRLIDAFVQVWSENPSVELYIMGSHGLAYEAIVKHARASVASESIFIILGSGNPFPLVAKMNAFVFSSFYEGIGLVLYEAFALGLPVLSTDIPGPSELLNQGYGLVVDNNVDGLVSGMQAALRGEVPQRPYDFEAHNRFALQQFYKAVGG